MLINRDGFFRVKATQKNHIPICGYLLDVLTKQLTEISNKVGVVLKNQYVGRSIGLSFFDGSHMT